MKKLFVLAVFFLFFLLFVSHPLYSGNLTLLYSTYLGDSDRATGIAVDSVGAAYITGYTDSLTFPTVDPYQSSFAGGTWDAFICKLDSSGSILLYSMYLGGYKTDVATDVFVTDGTAYICGYTESPDFPTENPYQAALRGGKDAFISRLASSGNILLFSTYLGGHEFEDGYGISVENENAYICGYTGSSDFPIIQPFQAESRGGADLFITKLDSTGSVLLYSTYLGGNDQDWGYDIDIENGEAYLTGRSESDNFPTVNPYQPARAGRKDILISKLNSSGSLLLYSTYLGGYGDERGHGISVENGEAYITGYTSSGDFPTVNAYQPERFNGDDAFISKISSSGSSLIYSTYLGGSSYVDRGNDIAVENGKACVGGSTGSSDFPVVNPYQSSHAGSGYDCFVSCLTSSGSSLIYSTYLGGRGLDRLYGIAGGLDTPYLCGETFSYDFPTRNPYQAGCAGYSPFVSRLSIFTPTPTPFGFHTPSPSPTPSRTPSPPSTPTPTASPSPTATFSPTPYGYKTPTPTPTAKPIIYVPDDYPTIQAAINAAIDGQTIIVRDGTYTGAGNRDIDFLGKEVTLRSENGPETTIIDAEWSGRLFNFISGETSSSLLEGLTLTRGYVEHQNGGGIYISNSSPRIVNCNIQANSSYADIARGGGICVSGYSAPVISHCRISGNRTEGFEGYLAFGAYAYGGGIFATQSTLITHCRISWNIAKGEDTYGPGRSFGGNGYGGGIYGNPTIENCLIYKNIASGGYGTLVWGDGQGGGFYGSGGLLTNSTVSDNWNGGGYGDYLIQNSIIWGNLSYQVSGGPTIVYSDIGGWSGGTGNIDEDPDFGGTGDYQLKPASPCIDAGDNAFATWSEDLYGNPRIWDGTVDMGSYEYGQPWGLPTVTPTPSVTPTTTPTPFGYQTPFPSPTPSPTAPICTRLDEGFDGFDTGIRPAGWIFSGCNSNEDTYTAPGDFGQASPSLKLSRANSFIETDNFSEPGSLQFWTKGISGYPVSRLYIEEYYGGGWNRVADIIPLPSTEKIFSGIDLNPDARRLKFIYSYGEGDIALDDIMITCRITPPPIPTCTSTAPPSSTPTVTPSVTPTPSLTPTPVRLVIAGSDYDGDGIFDLAVWKAENGKWAIGFSGGGEPEIFYYGKAGDIPVPGDYDGDGSTDAGIFRPLSGLWAVRGISRLYFGINGDIPVPGDYDGDGRVDPALFRESSGLWAVRGITRRYYGGEDDIPLPADYMEFPDLADGVDDIGIFRPSSGLWAIADITRRYFGRSGDRPVPAAYLSAAWGEEIAIFRPSSGLWAFPDGRRYYFGQSGDLPQPGRFSGADLSLITIYRPVSGLWAIQGQTRRYWGGPSYIPLVH